MRQGDDPTRSRAVLISPSVPFLVPVPGKCDNRSAAHLAARFSLHLLRIFSGLRGRFEFEQAILAQEIIQSIPGLNSRITSGTKNIETVRPAGGGVVTKTSAARRLYRRSKAPGRWAAVILSLGATVGFFRAILGGPPPAHAAPVVATSIQQAPSLQVMIQQAEQRASDEGGPGFGSPRFRSRGS